MRALMVVSAAMAITLTACDKKDNPDAINSAVAALDRSGRDAPADAYQRLEPGMSLEQANRALGAEGVQFRQQGGETEYEWRTVDGRRIVAKFASGIMVGHDQR